MKFTVTHVEHIESDKSCLPKDGFPKLVLQSEKGRWYKLWPYISKKKLLETQEDDI